MVSIEKLLNEEPASFPTGAAVKVLRGRTMAKTATWFKAILLVDVGNKHQLRLYGWQKNKEGVWKVRQKFNISKGYSMRLSEILDAFAASEKASDDDDL